MSSAQLLSYKIKSQRTEKSNSPQKSQSVENKVENQNLDPLPLDVETIQAITSEPTLGQRVADAMAAKVGSWAFLIGQTVVLSGWVGANLMPGVPHWDESPFILLNLVFSFASAYTAPVVLMSQNRQSEEERKKAEYDHMVNRKASYDIEMLHKKIDILQSQQIQELTQIIKQQQQQINETKSILEPLIKAQQIDQYQVPDSKLNQEKYSVYMPFQVTESKEDGSKTIKSIYVSLGDSEKPSETK